MILQFFVDKSGFHGILNRLQMEHTYRGVEQLVARQAHNLEVVGSSPSSATMWSGYNGFELYPLCSFIWSRSILLLRFFFYETFLISQENSTRTRQQLLDAGSRYNS